MLMLLLMGYGYCLHAQTLGGNAVYQFLSQPNTAKLSALGGVNITSMGNDVGMVFHNPALLRPGMNGSVNTSFNAFQAGIRNYSITGAYHADGIATFAAGVNYFDYGTLTQTDASGNILGSFRPTDYVIQVMASRQYHERFWYGMTIKYIRSGYGMYSSSGLAFDAGITYYDSSNGLQVSLVAKNMGTQLTAYAGAGKEELPFDLQAGITKRLAGAPLQFSFTAHHMQAFNIYYNDTSFRSSEGDPGYAGRTTLQKLFSHVVLSAEAFLSEQLHITGGYHFQRRQDHNAYGFTSGLNGFSLGASVLLRKISMNYATGFYQRNLFHHLSLQFRIHP